MGILRLAWLSFTRRRGALFYIAAPTTVLFALVALLIGVESSLRWTSVDAWDRRIVRVGSWVTSSYFSRSDVRRIEQLPMVYAVGVQTDAGCSSGEEFDATRCRATSSSYLRIWRNQSIVTEEQLVHWDRIKNGVVVTRATALRNRWSEGQAISLPRDDKTKPTVPFVVVAIVDNEMGNFENIYVHPDYADEFNGRTLGYWVVWVQVDTPEHRAEIWKKIEQDFGRKSLTMWKMEDTKSLLTGGSILIITVIRGAGVLAIFLVMIISLTFISLAIEERRRELATMRAIGYRRSQVAWLIVVESILLILPGVIVGPLIPLVVFQSGFHLISFNILLGWQVYLACGAFGVFLGALMALLPALRASTADPLTSLREG